MQAARGASLNARNIEGADDADDAAGATEAHDGSTPVAGTGQPRRVVMFATVAALTIALDVVTKVAAVAFLADREPVVVVPGVLDLTLVRNPGAAFGLGTGQTWLLSAIAIVVVGVVLRMAGRLRDRGWALALGLLLGGAVGNLLDRLFRQPGPMRGHVIDFLQLPNWPVFNLADSAICLAAALVVWRSLRGVELDGRTE
ncbi:MAG TPA: signal peptidase II [Nocardioidaceae bacterium]|jgi:signal peptidase II|nr:signal peptidase II [Nocardioidaceae bacterium]